MMSKTKRLLVASLLLTSSLTFLISPTAVFAAFSSVPVADFPQANGEIHAIDVASDGAVYVGGSFTQIGGVARNRIAKILPDNTIDPDFNPNVDSQVTAIAISSDDATIYAGGLFSTVNGATTRNGVAAFSAINGVATAFNPNVFIGEAGVVNTLELNEEAGLVYAGGGFSVVNGNVDRTDLAAFDATTGEVTSFDAVVNSYDCYDGGDTVYALHYDTEDNQLYVAGHVFGFGPGSTHRRGLARVDATTGALDMNFNPNIRDTTSAPSACSTVYSVAVSDDAVYAGGKLNRVNGTIERQNLAAVSKTTGDALPLDVSVNGFVYALKYNEITESLFVGGGFSSVDGTTRNELAEINLATNELTTFNPNITTEESQYTVHALAFSSNGTLYAGGSFDQVGGSPRVGIAAFLNSDQDSDGTPNTEEQAAPNNGDANNDAIPDFQQANVTSILNTDSNEYVTIVSPSGTTLSTTTATTAPTEDGFTHLFGLTGFTISGVTPGDTIAVSLFYPNPDNLNPTTLTPKKYFPSTTSYQDLPTAAPTSTTLTNETIDGQPTLNLTYNLTDGGDYDLDSAADGSITDPVSLAMTDVDSQALADTGSKLMNTYISIVALVGVGAVLLVSQRRRRV